MPDLEEAFAVEFHHPAAPRQVAVVPEHAPGVEPDMRTVGQYVLALVVGRGDDVGFDLRAQVILHHDVVRSGGQQHDGGRGCDVAPDAADAEPLAAAHRLVEPFEFAFTASRLFGPESVPVVFQRPLLFIARGGVAQPLREALLHLPGHVAAEEGFDNGFYSIYRHNDLSRFTNKTVHAAITHARKVKKVFRRKTGSA